MKKKWKANLQWECLNEHYIDNEDFYQIIEGGSTNAIEMQCHLGLSNVKVSKMSNT